MEFHRDLESTGRLLKEYPYTTTDHKKVVGCWKAWKNKASHGLFLSLSPTVREHKCEQIMKQ